MLSIPMSHDQNDRHGMTKQAYFRDTNWLKLEGGVDGVPMRDWVQFDVFSGHGTVKMSHISSS